MKKLFALTACLLLSLTACSSQGKIDDGEALAKDLSEKITYQDELNLMDESLAKQLYGIDDAENLWVYTGSGATAEEVGVIQMADEASAKDALEKAQQRIETQKDAFTSYVPEEIPKLEKAVTEQYGEYVVLSVSDTPEQAKEVIQQHLK